MALRIGMARIRAASGSRKKPKISSTTLSSSSSATGESVSPVRKPATSRGMSSMPSTKAVMLAMAITIMTPAESVAVS